MVKKIVITGPESTGKSTLSQQLADKFQTIWVPEYARTYLKQINRPYVYEDLVIIAREQIASEEACLKKLEREAVLGENQAPFLFLDTDLYVIKVWSEFVFGKCDPWILEQLGSRNYDYFLLCNIDLPWAYDELREYPNLEPRRQLFHIYKDLLIHQHVPWTVIEGDFEQRLEMAVKKIQQNFPKSG